MPPELSATEIEKVLGDWYFDLALDTGLDFAGVAETIATLVRERHQGRIVDPAFAVALDRFAESWLEAPPLVRASVSSWMVGRAEASVKEELKASERCAFHGLARRARIDAHGANLMAALGELFVAFCRQADDEADLLGVPGDARP